jgi:multidrug efflux pump subunit AcrA (membrane-fusion protein)
MYVRVAFGSSATERTVPVVPASAVQTIDEQSLVFVATGDAGVFELRPVRLGARSGAQYQILEGLAVGDRVVTTGSFMLRAEWLKTQQSGLEHQH